MENPYRLADYHYDLPADLIAQAPATPRDSSRLLIVNRKSGDFSEIVFRDLAEFLNENDALVFNDTRVIPARLYGAKKTGAKIEVFLLRAMGDDQWRVLTKPARKAMKGDQVFFSETFSCEVLGEGEGGERVVQFYSPKKFEDSLERHGEIPLPHYIKRDLPVDQDKERYQTVYGSKPGAVAAPTAGLHFTKALLDKLAKKGVDATRITLHVGLGTFRPVQTEDIRDHTMHRELASITEEAAQALNQPKNRRICVGTTCCRTLESAAGADGAISAGEFETDLFIYPGYRFKYVEGLLTNFHLPCSSLLMLVSAFAGYELTMEAYRKAVKERFRFFSYGDAMLII